MRISVTQLKRFQDNLSCSTFTVCNFKSPFARDITRTKIIFFFYSGAEKPVAECIWGKHWHIITFNCRLFGGALFSVKFRCDKQMDYLRSDMKTWIRGTLTAVSGHYDPCLAQPVSTLEKRKKKKKKRAPHFQVGKARFPDLSGRITPLKVPSVSPVSSFGHTGCHNLQKKFTVVDLLKELSNKVYPFVFCRNNCSRLTDIIAFMHMSSWVHTLTMGGEKKGHYPLELLHTSQSLLPVGWVQLLNTGGRKYTCCQLFTHLSLQWQVTNNHKL